MAEGDRVEICARVMNITFLNFERFSDVFSVSTSDGSAIGEGGNSIESFSDEYSLPVVDPGGWGGGGGGGA